MKYYIVAGEKSGDLHAANLIRALQQLDNQSDFKGFGGDDMVQAGLRLSKHYKELAFMGFWEVFKNILTVRELLAFCKQDIAQYKPDAVILVDFAGFNLEIAAYTKKLNIRTFYYISPKIWAWNTSRAYKVKKLIDKMFVILPFEKEFYAKFGYEVVYVGNPVLDAIKNFNKNPNFLKEYELEGKKLIVILPGSRKQEIALILRLMIQIEKQFPEHQFVVAGVTSVNPSLYEPALSAGIPVVFGQTYNLLSCAEAALVTSGTATLETAIFKVPQVVCYKTSSLTYFLAKLLIKVKYICLPNLLLDRPLLRELIQDELNKENLASELNKVLTTKKAEILEGYAEIERLLEGEGASLLTAKGIAKELGII